MFIGVDVGGTNTDAVLMDGADLVGAVKLPTTADVTAGIVDALAALLAYLPPARPVDAVMVGTTHFTNALLERRRLSPTAVIRLALPATKLLPPLVDWPTPLRDAIGGFTYMVHGGHEFDGREISPLAVGEIRTAVQDMRRRDVRAVAVSGVFSPVNTAHEIQAAAVIREEAPEIRISLSHENGRMGLLERENAAALNACLGEMAELTIAGIQQALRSLGLSAPLYISQNDGTLMDTQFAARFPALTISSGPTNSMRGAAFLSGVNDGIVVDIGGTSTDVGALVGFPQRSGCGGANRGRSHQFPYAGYAVHTVGRRQPGGMEPAKNRPRKRRVPADGRGAGFRRQFHHRYRLGGGARAGHGGRPPPRRAPGAIFGEQRASTFHTGKSGDGGHSESGGNGHRPGEAEPR